MSKVNKVQLIGHVGQKPELKQTSDNIAVVTFTLATNESWKDDNGEKKTSTEWHNCVAFAPAAQIINQFVVKGSHILIGGKLKTRQYLNKAGENRYTTEILVSEILLLDTKDKP